MPMSNDEEREELVWRRIAENVTESVDKQIKRRYFWIALLFAAISWLGGAALITDVVQLKVLEKIEPAQKDVSKAQVISDQAAKMGSEMQITAKKIIEELEEAQKKAAELEATLNTVQQGTNEAIAQLQTAVARIEQVQAPVPAAPESLKVPAASESLKPRIIIRFGAHISQEEAKHIVSQLRDLSGRVSHEKSGAFVGVTSVRYFYEEDEEVAKVIAQQATQVLQQSGIISSKVLVAGLVRYPIKPPKGTLELWINRTT